MMKLKLKLAALVAGILMLIPYTIMLHEEIQVSADTTPEYEPVAMHTPSLNMLPHTPGDTSKLPKSQPPEKPIVEPTPEPAPKPKASEPVVTATSETNAQLSYQYKDKYNAYVVTVKPPYAVEKIMANDVKNKAPGLESMESVQKRKQPDVLVNASGWTIDTGKLMGLQIKDGEILCGWPSDPNATSGKESFVQMSDGTFKIYDCDTTPEQIVTDGGVNSWTFGHSVIRDGVPTDVSNSKWNGSSERTMIGVTADGTLKIVASYGMSAIEAQELAIEEGCYQAYLMDGGGSTQLMVNGESLIESSRALPDFFAVYIE